MSAIGRGLLRRAGVELTEGEDVLWVGRPAEPAAVRYTLRIAIVSLVAIAVAGIGYAFDVWSIVLGDAGSAARRAFKPL